MDGPARKSNRVLFREIYRDPDRKSMLRIARELLSLLFLYREIPAHYFSRYMFKKDISNYKDFVPNKLAGTISVRINDHKVKEVLDNKLFFNFFYSQFDIRVPGIVIYNHGNAFVSDGQVFHIRNLGEFAGLLSRAFEKNSVLASMIVKKTSASSSGKKIFRLSRQHVQEDPDFLGEIYQEVRQSGFLFQATVRQNKELDKLNPSCLNTIRIDTFINPDGTVEIGSAYLRMSIRNSHIDNISSGGCQVGISLESGRLKKTGYSLIQTEGVKLFTEHPVTGIVFEGFRIPYFDEVKELVKKAAGLMPGLRLIGWDVAVGESSPILIEGNSDYDVSGNDVAYGGYMANSVFKKVISEIRGH